jgi:hypothetical protein
MFVEGFFPHSGTGLAALLVVMLVMALAMLSVNGLLDDSGRGV